jgi:glycerate-2-kinase
MSSRERLTAIYYEALNAITAESIVKNNLSLESDVLTVCDEVYNLKEFADLYCFSVGKAGFEMAKVCEEVLGNRLKSGLAISHQKGYLGRMEHCQSTHPLVSEKSIEAGEKLLKFMKDMREDDLFIFCLSGGASAMIEKPIQGLSLEDFEKISASLLVSGIDIKALNSVRKAISQIKGGKLAEVTKAKGVVLVLSDVIGDDLKTIGSAPMMNGNVPHYIVGNNSIALEKAKLSIENEVEKAEVITSTLDLPSPKASQFIVQTIKEYNKQYESFCLLIGGETTSEVLGKGQGGRNQELALRLLMDVTLSSNVSILVAGSDGIDGNSPATGAFLDFEIYEKMNHLGLNPQVYLDNSDSYGFFKALGYDLTIGATGTNVMDFIIILKN